MENYTIVKQIGQGGQGRVYHCKNNTTQNDVAIKMVQLEGLPDVNKHLNETKMFSKLESPYICKFVDTFIHSVGESLYFCYVMKYFYDGDLLRYVHVNFPLPLPIVMEIMEQLLLGLSILHKNNLYGVPLSNL
jgi:serine/threonine protein kinase